MRLYSRAYALLFALVAIVVFHAAGQGSAASPARAPFPETAAESKYFVAPGRAQPGYRERDFRPHAAPARRDAQGGSQGKHALIPLPAPAAPEQRLVGARPLLAPAAGPSVAREWNRARAPPFA